MPGLIKVGKTTTHPSQRMAELHSTGVPTPFELEFSAIVDNCEKREKAAHRALGKFRIKSNREFFKIQIKSALEIILPKLGEFQLDFTRKSHNIETLIIEINRIQREKNEAEKLKQENERKLLYEKNLKIQNRRDSINEKINFEKKKLNLLGARPVMPECSGLDSFALLCFLPAPFGFLVWIGALQIFGKSPIFGFICCTLLFIGFLVNKDQNKNKQIYELKTAPFKEIESKISLLEQELEDVNLGL
jgi:hypothetical protein